MLKLQVLSHVLLLLRLTDCQLCNRQYNLQPNRPINITSYNFPMALPAGSSCKYQLKAPAYHVIHMTCTFEVNPNICQSKFLYISRDGDMQFRNAERICRTSLVTRSSNFQALSLGYESNSATTQQRARLSCEAVARPVPCNCGWSQPLRIANGVEAAKNEFPSMVGLRDVASSQRSFCGGSIISDRFIVTAAHCLEFQRVASRIVALIGDHDLSSDSDSIFASQYAIRSIIIHPEYRFPLLINDIALLQTVRTIEWSRGVAPICLPFGQTQLGEVYELVDIAGWGTLGFAAAKSNTLQKARLMTTRNSECSAQYNITIPPSLVCTYDHMGLGKDSCQYDSGGPVILSQRGHMFLLGVISDGRQCGLRYGYGINTRVSSHLNWIRRYVGNSVCVR